jgi:hypothetical protein
MDGFLLHEGETSRRTTGGNLTEDTSRIAAAGDAPQGKSAVGNGPGKTTGPHI